MKIAFVSLMRVADWGGSEELWSKTALLALARGHDVQSLTYGWGTPAPRITELSGRGVKTNFYFSNSTALIDRLAVRVGISDEKSKIFSPMDADIYVLSNGNIWDFTRYRAVTDFVLSKKKPFIIIGHNTLDWGDTLEGEQREYAIRVFERARKVLFVSERNRLGAERQMAKKIKNAQLVENPTSIRAATIKQFPESSGLLMASVGTIDCSTKGQDLLLEALSGEAWKSRDFRLRIYGKGPHVPHLNDLIEFYGLQGKVTLEGHVRDVDRIWEINQVLILPSLTEGGPMVVVEAMLSGRAVLATDVGAVERYVQERVTGYIVPVAKAKYLAVGLEELWDNRNALKQMGENAFHRASEITAKYPEQAFLNIIEAACQP